MSDYRRLVIFVLGVLLAVNAAGGAATAAPAKGPLRVLKTNPRYFTDGSGQAILLTGAHTWDNLVDMGPTDPPAPFDYPAYLEWLAAWPHNFMRMWTWEMVSWDTAANREKKAQVHYAAPQPYQRSGPGTALDGKPKFNLEQFNPDYFERLRQRVQAAGERGIYVSIMLFEGWGVQFVKGGWASHPFNAKNNVNGVEGDRNGDGVGVEVHELTDPRVTALQEAYVRKVVDTVNDLDNVLYEISNENHPPSTAWEYHMINFVKNYEKTKPKQHPVGMTFQYKGGSNKTLLESPADWISPNTEGGYKDDPPAADGRKVIISDTDHLWGIGGNTAWVWKSFMRGVNPIFMDPYKGKILDKGVAVKTWDPVRRSMGQALAWSRRIGLAAMTPRAEAASSKYCLANPGREYLVYQPVRGVLTVKVAPGSYTCEVFNPATGKTAEKKMVKAGPEPLSIKPPFGGEAVFYLRRVNEKAK